MGQFTVALQQFADKTKQRSNDIVGRIAVSIARELDERSPVGDASYWTHPAPKGYVGGRFRGNWQLGVNFIPAGETGRIDPSGSETLSNVIASIPDQPAGTVLYYGNNSPYGPRIEDGWSRQAPQGLVSLTALKFQQFADQAAAA